MVHTWCRHSTLGCISCLQVTSFAFSTRSVSHSGILCLVLLFVHLVLPPPTSSSTSSSPWEPPSLSQFQPITRCCIYSIPLPLFLLMLCLYDVALSPGSPSNPLSIVFQRKCSPLVKHFCDSKCAYMFMCVHTCVCICMQKPGSNIRYLLQPLSTLFLESVSH